MTAHSHLLETGGTLLSRSASPAHLARSQSPLDAFAEICGRELAALRPVLSSAQFKTLVYSKGWTLRLLADRWCLAPESVRRLAGDPMRSPSWDDAARGLPVIGQRRKPRRAWLDELGATNPLDVMGQSLSGVAGATAARIAAVPKLPGFRYHGYMVMGAVVAVAKHLGELADEGMHGLVVQVVREKTQERYRVVFETGGIEMFTPDLVDEYLVTTGLEENGLAGYAWRGEDAARQDFEAGMFVFEVPIDELAPKRRLTV